LRVKAIVAYNGFKFLGFQRQKSTDNTISETIEKALISLGIDSKIVGSGRTDKGVHATGQVIHFNLPLFWQKKSLLELKRRLNQKLKYIEFKYIKEVEDSFHAQYSAKSRVYRYIIKTTKPTIFEKEFVSYYKIEDFNLLNKALNIYIGKHNFKNFKKEGSITSSDIREVYRVKVKRVKNYYIIYFYANGYLRSQIRMMVEGALMVEKKDLTLKNLKDQLNNRDKYFTTLAKPEGLYLHKVFY